MDEPSVLARSARQRLGLLLGFLVVSSLVLAIGAISFLKIRTHLRQSVENELTTIAEQKREQLEQLVSELDLDIGLFAGGNATVAARIERWIKEPVPNSELGRLVRERLEELSHGHRYSSIALFDAEGQPRLVSGTVDVVSLGEKARSVIETRRSAFVDLHRLADGTIQFGILAPVSPQGRDPRAAILLMGDANKLIYPMVGRWPVPGKSAASYLVRRDQQEATLISPLPGRPNAELSFSRSIDDPELPGSAAARGHHGIFRGRDYRDQVVLAYTTPVAGSPWFLVAKMDVDEADSGIEKLAWATAAALTLALGLLYVLALWVWNRDRWRREQAALLSRQQAEARYRLLYEKAPMGIALIDSLNGRIYEANPRYAAIVGRTRDELKSMDWMQITHPDDVQEDLANMKRLISGEIDEFDMQKRYLRPDGSVVWIDMLIAPLGIRIEGGPSHACVVEDITENKRAEATIRQRTLELDQFFDLSMDLLCIVHSDGWFIRVNPAWELALGYTAAELETRAFIDFVHPDDRRATLRQLADHLNGARVIDFRNRYRTKQGRYRWLEWRSSPAVGELIFAVARDITDRIDAEEALRTSRELFASAFRDASIGMALVAPNGHWLKVNPALCRLVGYDEEELQALSFQDITHPEDLESDLDYVRQTLSGERAGYRMEKRYVHKSGHPIWTLLSVSLLRDASGVPLHFVSQMVDIDERKRMEDAQSFLLTCGLPSTGEDFFHALARYLAANLSMEYICIDRLEGDLLSARTLAVFHDGRFEDDIRYTLKDTPCGAVLDESVCCYERDVRRLFPHDEALDELRAESYVGTVLWDSQGRPIGLIAVIGRRELNQPERARALLSMVAPRAGWELERREVERRLRESEERLEDVLDHSPALIFMKDLQGRYLRVNRSCSEFLGWPQHWAEGRTVDELFPPDVAEALLVNDRQVRESKRSIQVEEVLCDRHGVPHTFLSVQFPLRDFEGEVYATCGISTDISDRKQAEVEFKAYQDELERRVAERTADLRALNQQLGETVFALESAGTGIYRVDTATGQLVYVNRHAADMLGYSPSEMLKLRVPQFDLQFDTPEVFARHVGDVLTKGGARFETMHRHRDGHTIPVEMTVYPQPDPDGSASTRFIAFGVDISERLRTQQALKRSEEQLRLALDAGKIGTFEWNPVTNESICNEWHNRLWGYPPGEGVHSYADYVRRIHPDDVNAVEAALRRSLETREHYAAEFRVVWPDGSARWISEMGEYQFDDDGHAARMCGVVLDVTERKLGEAARERAVVAAENLARLRQEFVANMSHELRTPLSGVLGFAQIGMQNCRNSDKAFNAFQKILQSGQHLLGVVNDILDFSKIEQGKLTIESLPVDVGGLIDDVMDPVRGLAETKHLDLRVQKHLSGQNWVQTDPLRLRQILGNLLANAVKFTEAGSVTLSVRIDGAQLVFEVLDTGIGMTPEQRNRLFRPFEQADGSFSRKYGGTGLGLTITDRLVHLLEGCIDVISEPGSGSRFTVRIPCRPAKHPPVSADGAPGHVEGGPPVLEGIRLLLADDDEINRIVAEELLVTEGARVTSVSNGAEAVEQVLAGGGESYDVILMDLQMPVVDGLTAATQIRAIAPGIPIIALTAHAFHEERARVEAVGMVDHVVKPYRAEDLIAAVLTHARRHAREMRDDDRVEH